MPRDIASRGGLGPRDPGARARGLLSRSAMDSHDVEDPAVAEAEHRAERAKASLLARLEQLKHKVSDARHQLDVPSQIAAHPLPAVGIALALGAVVALGRSRPVAAAAAEPSGHPLRSAALTALAGFGLRMVREVALTQLGNAAREWWSQHEPRAEREDREVETSHQAELEPFLAR